MRTDKIYLVGFMGAGKSTLGRALARRLGWRVEDVDTLIETRERATVSEIFASRGEPFFRAAEREVVRQLLPPRHVVVATGGGTYADPESRRLINADGAAIWLDLPFDRALERVPADGRRPLAADRDQFEALYAVRRLSYLQAHLRLDVSRAPVEELVERILDWLGY
ncbi:MAG: shikimate kinase [Acidobacteria bacterium]|nr:MAG: shikimate kinase [Acidobacteriota bacterium]RPJ77062.1 MAG: shikimate kinase [Acidobacteriota bacterium]